MRYAVIRLRTLSAVLMVGAALAAGLAGCGKKSAPTAPPGEPDTYHRTYPSE